MIENAESYEDTYPAIKKALSVCGGKHSMFMTKSESQDTTESYDKVLPTVSLDGDIAIINSPISSSQPKISSSQPKRDRNTQKSRRTSFTRIAIK